MCLAIPAFSVDAVGEMIPTAEVDGMWDKVVRVYGNPFSDDSAYFIPGMATIPNQVSNSVGYAFANALQYYDKAGVLSGFDDKILADVIKLQPLIDTPDGRVAAMAHACGVADIVKSQYQSDMRRNENSKYRRSDDIPPRADDYSSLFLKVQTVDQACNKVKDFASNRDLNVECAHLSIAWDKFKSLIHADVPVLMMVNDGCLFCLGYIETGNRRYIMAASPSEGMASAIGVGLNFKQYICIERPRSSTLSMYLVKAGELDVFVLRGWQRESQSLQRRIETIKESTHGK